jgi:hypothetical protein
MNLLTIERIKIVRWIIVNDDICLVITLWLEFDQVILINDDNIRSCSNI